eukprot:s1903_g9.t1
MSFGISYLNQLRCAISKEPQVEDRILVQTSDLPVCLAGRREASCTLAVVKRLLKYSKQRQPYCKDMSISPVAKLSG